MLFRKVYGTSHHYVTKDGVIKNRKTGNILAPYKAKNGYMYVKPCENNQTKHIAVHRAVGFAFVDGFSTKKNIIDHKDGNKENNHFLNLRWVTQKENIKYGHERNCDNSVKNHTECIMYVDGKKHKEFISFADASKYAVRKYDCSSSMLIKHHKHKNVELKKM